MQNVEKRLKSINRRMSIIDYKSEKEAWINEGRLEIIHAMMKNGIDDNTISNITSWSVDDVIKERKRLIE